MRKRPCLLFACSFLTGIVFQRYKWKVLWLVPLALLGIEIFYGIKFEKSFKRIAGRSLFLLSAFFLGMSHMHTEELFRDAYLAKLEDNSNAVIYGEILNIEETEYGCRLILTDCYVSLNEANIPCNKVMVYASSDQFRVGQIHQIKGKLHLFENTRNEGNFDSACFYQSQKIDFYLYEAESSLLGYKENWIKDEILGLKLKIETVYRNSLEQDAAGFYMGMMLGDKSLLSDETKDLFAVGGISHILAISGLHMSIIGRGFYQFLRKRRMGFLLAGVLAGLQLFSYCYMTGSGTSAIRAVGMMLLFFFAQYVGRSYDMLNALGVVVVYLLWENPFLIDYSGFQFSVAALIGVGFVGQTLFVKLEQNKECGTKEDIGRKSNGKVIGNLICGTLKSWSSSLWMSLGITLTTLPIVASCYFEVPLYSPLVNSLLLPLLTPVFVLALVGALLGCIVPMLGSLILIPCEWLFSFYEFVCKFVEELPFGVVITGKPSMEEVVLYYAVLFAGCLVIRRLEANDESNICKRLYVGCVITKHLEAPKAKIHQEKNKAERSGTSDSSLFLMKHMFKLCLSMTCFLLVLFPRKLVTEIIFLDVGQGDAIYIASEDGTTCFIDGGSSDVNEVGMYRILPFLKAHGVKYIDYWFVSHADNDHISGLLEILEDGYDIRHLVVSDKMPEDEGREKLLALAAEQEITVIQMKTEERIESVSCMQTNFSVKDGISISCLYPWSEGVDKNEQSLVLLVEFFDKNATSTYCALFSGDISSKGEAELIQQGVLEDVDLYKAAHHGSKYSNSQAFLDMIQPEICVISCGEDNSYGHPHTEAVEVIEQVGAEVLYTMENGQVTIKIPSE